MTLRIFLFFSLVFNFDKVLASSSSDWLLGRAPSLPILMPLMPLLPVLPLFRDPNLDFLLTDPDLGEIRREGLLVQPLPPIDFDAIPVPNPLPETDEFIVRQAAEEADEIPDLVDVVSDADDEQNQGQEVVVSARDNFPMVGIVDVERDAQDMLGRRMNNVAELLETDAAVCVALWYDEARRVLVIAANEDVDSAIIRKIQLIKLLKELLAILQQHDGQAFLRAQHLYERYIDREPTEGDLGQLSDELWRNRSIRRFILSHFNPMGIRGDSAQKRKFRLLIKVLLYDMAHDFCLTRMLSGSYHVLRTCSFPSDLDGTTVFQHAEVQMQAHMMQVFGVDEAGLALLPRRSRMVGISRRRCRDCYHLTASLVAGSTSEISYTMVCVGINGLPHYTLRAVETRERERSRATVVDVTDETEEAAEHKDEPSTPPRTPPRRPQNERGGSTRDVSEFTPQKLRSQETPPRRGAAGSAAGGNRRGGRFGRDENKGQSKFAAQALSRATQQDSSDDDEASQSRKKKKDRGKPREKRKDGSKR